jgi:hypothetical protein
MLRVPFIPPSWIFKKNLITLNLLVLQQRLLFFVPAKSQENSNKFIPQQISCNDARELFMQLKSHYFCYKWEVYAHECSD